MSSKLPHEYCLHLQVRVRRPKHVDKLARSQFLVHAQREEIRVLSAHIGGKTPQGASLFNSTVCRTIEESVVGHGRAAKALRVEVLVVLKSLVQVNGDPVATGISVDVRVYDECT
jgi:hypothetical protein